MSLLENIDWDNASYDEALTTITKKAMVTSQPTRTKQAFDIPEALKNISIPEALKNISIPEELRPALIGSGVGAGLGLLRGTTRKKKRYLSDMLSGAALGGLGGGLYNVVPRLAKYFDEPSGGASGNPNATQFQKLMMERDALNKLPPGPERDAKLKENDDKMNTLGAAIKKDKSNKPGMVMGNFGNFYKERALDLWNADSTGSALGALADMAVAPITGFSTNKLIHDAQKLKNQRINLLENLSNPENLKSLNRVQGPTGKKFGDYLLRLKQREIAQPSYLNGLPKSTRAGGEPLISRFATKRNLGGGEITPKMLKQEFDTIAKNVGQNIKPGLLQTAWRWPAALGSALVYPALRSNFSISDSSRYKDPAHYDFMRARYGLDGMPPLNPTAEPHRFDALYKKLGGD